MVLVAYTLTRSSLYRQPSSLYQPPQRFPSPHGFGPSSKIRASSARVSPGGELRKEAHVSGQLANMRKSKVLTSIVVSIVRACTRFAWPTLIVGLVLSVGGGYYTARHFVINTDINTLISENLDW